MFNKGRIPKDILNEYLNYEREYPKSLGHAIALYILGAAIAIIFAAFATAKIVEIGTKLKNFKDWSR